MKRTKKSATKTFFIKKSPSKVLRAEFLNFRKSASISVKHLQKSLSHFLHSAERRRKLIIKSNPTLIPSTIAAFSLFAGVILGHSFLPVATSIAAEDYQLQLEESSTVAYQPKNRLEAPEALATATVVQVATAYASQPAGTASTSSISPAPSASDLSIPALGINTAVSPSVLSNQELSVPDYGVSVYGTLYMGHSSGVFANLAAAVVGQDLYLSGQHYSISSVQSSQSVWTNRQGVGGHSMRRLINLGPDQIVLMTCAGTYQPGFGWTQRTLVFATLVA